jgi:hypothetical protein
MAGKGREKSGGGSVLLFVAGGCYSISLTRHSFVRF